jgi:hypothetical protein
MAQNAFRKHKGKWVLKEHTLAASAGAVEMGDLIQVTSGGITVALGTSTATAIIGISAEDIADVAATKTIRVWEPQEKRATMIGRTTDGAIAVGDTDSGRTCDLEDHEGADTDTDAHHHLIIVKGRVAAADGSVGEAEFRIAQDLENLNSF